MRKSKKLNRTSQILFATALATMGFVLSGGVQAAEQAIRAEETGKAPETSIPFVNQGGVRDWQAVGESTIYVQDASGSWYKATLMGPCPDLPFAKSVGFETKGVNKLDKFSAIVISGQRYPLASFVASGPPPKPGA